MSEGAHNNNYRSNFFEAVYAPPPMPWGPKDTRDIILLQSDGFTCCFFLIIPRLTPRVHWDRAPTTRVCQPRPRVGGILPSPAAQPCGHSHSHRAVAAAHPLGGSAVLRLLPRSGGAHQRRPERCRPGVCWGESRRSGPLDHNNVNGSLKSNFPLSVGHSPRASFSH